MKVDAVEWCLLGAIFKCYRTMEKRKKGFAKLENIIENRDIPAFNDDSPWRKVRAALVKADV